VLKEVEKLSNLAEAATFMTSVWETPASNLGRETNYSE
jgi:hypothetical protein